MIRYYVNEKKRTVSAVLGGVGENVKGDALKYYFKGSGYFIKPFPYIQSFYINDKYVGVAKCHPDDAFDVETGKEIAKAKCLSKYYRDRDRAVVDIWQHVVDANQKVVEHLLDDMSNSLESEEDMVEFVGGTK